MIFASDGQTEDSGFDIQINQIACQTIINKPRINSKVASGFNRNYNSFEHHSAQCDQLITGKHQIIVSPNYPHQPPINSNCQYSIYKYSESVCQVRLQLLDFDLETSNQCQNDYLMIMNTGERFCGKELQSASKSKFTNDTNFSFYKQQLSKGDNYHLNCRFHSTELDFIVLFFLEAFFLFLNLNKNLIKVIFCF